MMKEQQKRTKQVNVYINEKEQELIESYISKQEEYQAVSTVFRTALLEKIRNETKDKDYR